MCKSTIETTFLDKPIGAYIRKNNKQYTVCNKCQHKFKDNDKLLENIK